MCYIRIKVVDLGENPSRITQEGYERAMQVCVQKEDMTSLWRGIGYRESGRKARCEQGLLREKKQEGTVDDWFICRPFLRSAGEIRYHSAGIARRAAAAAGSLLPPSALDSYSPPTSTVLLLVTDTYGFCQWAEVYPRVHTPRFVWDVALLALMLLLRRLGRTQGCSTTTGTTSWKEFSLSGGKRVLLLRRVTMLAIGVDGAPGCLRVVTRMMQGWKRRWCAACIGIDAALLQTRALDIDIAARSAAPGRCPSGGTRVSLLVGAYSSGAQLLLGY
ncbi:hypothetical protein C8R44DRAFT_751156 [Mycena epipterygia]|nr:hypothetical protein C8R44DRAFT_751156 [Mycena epipterygia]